MPVAIDTRKRQDCNLAFTQRSQEPALPPKSRTDQASGPGVVDEPSTNTGETLAANPAHRNAMRPGEYRALEASK